VWLRRVIALSLLSLASSLVLVVMVAAVESCLAWVSCCCHPTLDLGGGSRCVRIRVRVPLVVAHVVGLLV